MLISHRHDNIPKVKVPEESLYHPIKAQLEAGTQEYHAANSMRANAYADQIINDILAGREGRVLRGNSAWFHWILFTWLPGWLFDWAIARETGLDKLSLAKKAI
jgi:1-acylglycerone phosphate reductase